MATMNVMGRFQRLTLIFLLCVYAQACVAPTTKGLAVDQSLVEKERQYQLQLSLQQQIKYQQQLDNVAWSVLVAALPLCDTEFQKRDLGFSVASLGSFPVEMAEAAKATLNMGDALQVVTIATGSPAAATGIKVGDKLISMNGILVMRGRDAAKNFDKTLASLLEQDNAIKLRIERAGVPQDITLKGQKLCYFPPVATMGDEVNAYADGKYIVVSKGMLRFVENDLELSTVVAHELAHNMMRHMDAKKSNYWLGTAADLAAALAGVNTQGNFGRMGAMAYSQDFESEADYVGVYVQALANQSIENIAGFWRRMAAEHPAGIKENHGASHPSTPQRFIAIEQTVQEIRNKQKAGFALVPDRQ
jgi:hypothetical protein